MAPLDTRPNLEMLGRCFVGGMTLRAWNRRWNPRPPRNKRTGRCFYCGVQMVERHKQLRPTRDHVIPKSRGGQNSVGNKVWCCNRCNTDKRNLMLAEYRLIIAARRGIETDQVKFFGEKVLTLWAMSRAVGRSAATEVAGHT